MIVPIALVAGLFFGALSMYCTWARCEKFAQATYEAEIERLNNEVRHWWKKSTTLEQEIVTLVAGQKAKALAGPKKKRVKK